MVDKPKLDQLLARLRAYIGVLRALGAVPKPAFMANPDKVGNAKYHFVVGIECCIDIANHIIASEDYRFPRDNADSFTVLAERDVIPPELGEGLRGMARFRNRLVHLYGEIDDDRVYGYLQDSLEDMDRFLAAIAGRSWPSP
jgi:uncharacterized protein YutE (UPF0331/DUF86 family)